MDDAAKQRLSGDQIATMDLDDWRSIHLTLRTRFATGDFMTGLQLVTAIAQAAEEANHHPDVDLRYGHVDVVLTSHDVGAKTMRDVDLARRISGIAAEMGVSAQPETMQVLEIGLDTWDAAQIKPFWAAVLGVDEAEDEIVDPAGVVPTVWFQECQPHDVPAQRFHLDIRVPPEVAPQRIEAALAAGGVLVSDARAPRFTVLADAQGNKVCVCTHVGRSD